MMLSCPRAVAVALALAAHAAAAAYTAQLLYQFPSHAQWVENMAVRPNGHLLLTTFDRARVYELAPSQQQQTPRLVAALPAADAALGIAEIRPDVFAVATGRLNRTSFHLDGSARIDTLDFTCRGCATQPAIATAAALLPHAKLPNGLAALHRSSVVLCADSATGTIYRADTATGAVHVALHDPALAPAPTAADDDDPFLALLGVNGLQVPGDGFVYVTSTSARLLGRYALDNAAAAAALEVLARYAAPRSPDDFAVARNGTVFGAVPLDSVSVVAVLPGKKGLRDVRFLVDHDERMQRPTSVVLSRDETTLYVSTGGRNVPGGKGGQVFAVRLT
ncbi:Six-bladed beta-propeller, TolB-like protein [Cordyceps militaris CM01]|uniref:Six-bladed beta-propeller, TolB-like protein n=1 Tax=Cordyceps militaris (strain CM01) TaxID=983644 RepID=G3JJV9_CORMM|nr:Six-bladed beta-propeller, TolB-like protein [Cordyceps militaris CM01]EGX92143.1 Six-bladed beta-propeller, TolB-like protein [Cordyceps militaris CM01]